MSNDTKKILIDLNLPRDAQAFTTSDEIIQQDLMKAFYKLVNSSLASSRGFGEKLQQGNLFERTRYHDTITVLGSRGSGKTTFILNMFKLLHSDKAPEKPLEGCRYEDVEILGILDPTLIEEKEHVFLNILARIKNKVDEKRKGETEKRRETCPDIGSYQDWLACLRKLAAALPLLDGVGSDDFLKSEQWHDPINVLEKGLQVASASNGLEIQFHQFVYRSLRILNKKAFILAIDDIDTKFPSGWPVLEVIRKYLTTPQLIVVLSGDVALYSRLVRKQQWQNFGKELLDQERLEKSRNEAYSILVDQLESQYLLKVLKPERRFNLATLQQVGADYTIQVKIKESEKLLTDYVDEMFDYSHWLKGNSSDLKLYRTSLLQEPVRTIIQVLYGYNDCRERTESRQAFINTLADTFLVALQRYGFSASFAKQPDVRIMLNQLVQKLAKENLLERGYRLKAEFDDADLNRLMWVLGAVMVEQLRHHPGLYFDFLIKVGLSREMALRLPMGEGVASVTLKDYLYWVGVYEGENSMTIARMAAGAMRFISEAREKTTHIGTVRVMNDDAKESKTFTSKDPDSLRRKIEQHYRMSVTQWQTLPADINSGEKKANPFAAALPKAFLAAGGNAMATVNAKKVAQDHKSYYCNSLEELENNIGSWHKLLVNIPAHRLITRDGEARTIYSIHGLLAFIGELLQAESVEKTLRTYSQLRDYPWPAWDHSLGATDTLTDDVETEEESENVSVVSIPEEIVQGLEKWKKDFAKAISKNPLPTHIWAKVFTRFFYALQNLDQNLVPQERYLGHIMHRSIILFLNAVLVEEAIFRGFSDKVSLKNPAKSDKIFYKNLSKFESTENKENLYPNLPFFSKMAICPLWSFFLFLEKTEQESVRFPKIKPIVTLEHEKSLCTYCGNKNFLDFYSLLNSVVLVNDYKVIKTTKKITWSKDHFPEIVAGKEEEIRDRLSHLSPEEATRIFIKEYLTPKFDNAPQKKTGGPFKNVTELLKNKKLILS